MPWVLRFRSSYRHLHHHAKLRYERRCLWTMKGIMRRLLLIFVILWAPSLIAQTAHTAAWTINTSSCTTTAPCTAQIYRAVIASGNCPQPGSTAYLLIPVPTNPAPSVDPTQTTWQYTDSGTALTSGSTYCGYSTVTFTAGGGPTGASAIFQGQIPATPIAPPANAPGVSIILK